MGDNIKIIVRIRPMLSFDNEPVWMVKNNSLIAIQNTKQMKHHTNDGKNSQRDKVNQSNKDNKEVYYQFNFQNIVNESHTTQQIFKKDIKATLYDCCNNFKNLSIIAYGQTCSGKTHTILGVKQSPGLIPCVLRELFTLKKNKKCLLKMSYIEIYNQKLRDLLDKNDKTLKLTQDEKWGCQIFNSEKLSLTSLEQGLKILQKGQKQRQYGNGQYHERSSRSHTLLRIFVQQWDANLVSKCFSITIVDLAGSQRLKTLEQSNDQTGYINKSLFQLSNCIYKLSQNSSHIPFRDSKLTKIIEPSLIGYGRSLLICCISPSKQCFSQSLSTLRLAQRAKKIQLKEQPELPTEKQYEKLLQKLKIKEKQCLGLKNEINKLAFKIENLQEQVNYLKHANNSQKIKAKLVILLDHQNAQIFLQDKIQQKYIQSEDFRLLKQLFRDKLHNIYEQYIREITSHCKGKKNGNIKLQIDEICFMNMILEHQKINQYKINVISSLISEKSHQNGGNQIFYQVLENYLKDLISKYNVNNDNYKSVQSHDRSYKISLDSIQFDLNNDPKESNHVQKIKYSQRQQEYGCEILAWGSKKDHRVCRGTTNHLGMTKVSNLVNIKLVSCGYHHTFAITKEGALYGWGKNTYNQIANINKDSIATPMLIKDIKRVKNAVGGWGHSLVLTNDGEVYSWGYGLDGQLGHNNNLNYAIPNKIELQSDAISIFAGHSHSAYLDSSGNLYSFGFNHDYRLMIGDQREICSPKKIAIKDIIQASLGVSHSAVITSSGLVYCGGTGTNGQLGVNLDSSITGWQKLQVADRQFEDVNYEKICPIIQVQKFNYQNRAKKIKCGQNMTILLTQKGQVYTFGKSLSGRLGHNKNNFAKILDNIDKIQCGCRNGLAYNTKQNKLYSWGFNIYGQSNPTVKSDVQQPQLIQNLSSQAILSLSSGYFHTAILLK